MSKKKTKNRQTVRSPAVLRQISLRLFEIGSTNLSLNEDIDLEALNNMYNDIHVNTAIESLLRGVASRELIFKSEINDKEEDTILLELQKRFNRIKNKTNFIKEIGKACFFGYTLHEIEYNEDFSMRRFVSIPRSKLEFDKEKKKWKIKGKEEVYVEENGKWLMSIYDESIENFKGNTKLRAIYQIYQEINEIKKKVNAIVEKYGSVIPVFAYNTKLSDEEVKEAAKEIKAMYGENVLAIPLEDGNLKDNFFFITLNDLDIHIHNTIIEKAENKIFQNLLGGTLAVGTGEGSNSYALGKVHETEKEKIENEISLFIRDELDKLIEIDGNIFGYESEQYYISIELPEDREKILQIENLEEDKMNKKAETIAKLTQSGYEIEDTELQEIFGYKTLKKKEQQQQITNPFTEFSKKNAEDSNKKTLEYLERLRKCIVPEISKKIADQIKNITSIEDIKNIDTGIKDHKNSLILSELWGQYLTIKDRSKVFEYKKKSEFATYSEIDLQDIFNMTFNEAINWLLNREPQMYDQIQRVMERYRTNYFWIKRSTDLEIIKTLYAELLKNLELGQTFEDFKKNIDLESLGFGEDGYYLRQVFDQTMINAQSVGQWEQLQEGMRYGFIYGLYDAILDGRETDLCRILDGKIYRLDSPFWEVYYPPNHFKCRSRVTALSEEDMTNYGYRAESGDIGTEPQKGFDKNIGVNYISGIKKYVNQKEKEAEALYKKVSNYEG